MAVFEISKGRDLKIKGMAQARIVERALPPKVALVPANFRNVKFSLAAKEGDQVKVGSLLLVDKAHPQIKFVSPASGTLAAINRGAKRVLLSLVIETDGRQEAVFFKKFVREETERASREQILEHLLAGGCFPLIRQRPFSKIANPQDVPKSIFVHAMNSEPLALDIDFILADKEQEFQTGLDILRKLTTGKVHLCFSPRAKSRALTQAQGVDKHQFAGPHPAGNVSTHIHCVDPIKKGDVVWYIEAQDVVRIAKLFINGSYSPEQIVAVTGEGVDPAQRTYARTVQGAPLKSLMEGHPKEGLRYISGSVLTGTTVGRDGYLGIYDSQISVIPEGGKRYFLGWLTPGFSAYSFSKRFASSFLPEQEASLTTDKQGSDRAIVLNHIYDDYVPLDIMTFFLMRALMAGEIEEAEKLGILECDEEDFALCSFACPSKTNVGLIIRNGLDLIEKEG